MQQITPLLHPLLASYHAAQLALEELPRGRFPETVEAVRQQVSQLMPTHFLIDTPWCWLEHYPRYLTAICQRLDKLRRGDGLRDARTGAEILPLDAMYRQRIESHRQRGIVDSQLELFRWMLEEFRVSLFAQQLGTSMKVSVKRLERQWAEVTP